MTRNKKISIAAVTILILYSLAGFFLLPYVIQKMLPEKLGSALNRSTSVRNVRFNPFTLTLTLQGFQVKEKDGAALFIAFDELMVNAQLSSLFHMGPVVKEITLVKPVLHITRMAGERFNFSDMLEKKEPETEQPEQTEAPPLQFSINNIQIRNGEIQIDDQVVRKTHSITDLTFTLPFISNFDKHIDTHTKPGLNLKFNDTQITAEVATKPFTQSRETSLHLIISGIDLPRYFGYVPSDPGFTVTDGTLDIDSQIFFKQPADQTSFLQVSGTVTLANLALVDTSEQSLVRLAELAVELAPSRVLEKEIHLKNITLKKPEIEVRRDAAGTVNLLALGGKSEPAAQEETTEEPSSAQPSEPVTIMVDSLSVNSAWIRMQDGFVSESTAKTLTKPVAFTVGPMNLDVQHFTTQPSQQADFRFNSGINEKGDLEINGRFGISPITADGKFAARDIVFTWLEPYLRDNIELAIADGQFSSSGSITVAKKEDQDVTVSLKCDASVENVKTADKIQGENFLTLGGLYLNQVDVTVNPTQVAVGEIKIQNLTNRIIVYDDGTLNLNRILPAPAAPEAPKEEAAPERPEPPSASDAVPVTISQVTLQDIKVGFLDKQAQPNFSTNLKLTRGGIAGLTSENFKSADVSIQGNVDDYAPLEITGKINPLQEELYTDIKINLKELELSPFTPYSGKFIGRAIEKGKLSLNLEYRIDKNVLTAEDKLLFDQLTMGKDMESPDAQNIPIDLVISILQDRKGKIHLDVPISGRLDDPDFSLKNVIVQTFLNIVEKAATSPFDLIAGIAGGGEELQYIEFQPGADGIDDKGGQKLDAVITVLYERPGLKLGLTGYIDEQQDRTGLQTMALDQKIKNRKRLALIADGQSPGPVEQIEISAAEYPDYLKQVASEEMDMDFEEGTPLETMKEQIRNRIAVNDSDLRLLAINRAKSVRAYILRDDRIEPERLFLSEAASLAPEKKDQYASERVELSLQ